MQPLEFFLSKKEDINYTLKKVNTLIKIWKQLLIFNNKHRDALFPLTKHCFILNPQ